MRLALPVGRNKEAEAMASIWNRQPQAIVRWTSMIASRFTPARRSLRALRRTAIFFLKVFPMLPSRPVDWLTAPPLIEQVSYPTTRGPAVGDLYRPSTGGPHPGIVVCLGVVPFGVEHPQVAVLGRALARAGFVALLYWSPAMRDFRLEPADIESIALAFGWLIDHPAVDPERCGLLGTCVGGSFVLMAAASPRIKDRVGFIGAYAPYASLWTLARDITSATRLGDNGREPWPVDPLTRKVFVASVTALLTPTEGERLRQAFAGGPAMVDAADLSSDGRAVAALLSAPDLPAAEAALRSLPPAMQERLVVLSPLEYLGGIRAAPIILLHDRGDPVVPVDESRRLFAALAGQADVRYTEMLFQHLDPVKGRLPLRHLVREFGKFCRAVYPIFQTTERR